MNNVIGYTQRELIEVMLSAGIHCSMSKFEEVAAAIQQKLIDATGVSVKIEVITEPS